MIWDIAAGVAIGGAALFAAFLALVIIADAVTGPRRYD